MYKYLSSHMNERVLSKQVLRSGTSVGANVNESRNAQSTSDFISKLSIALKEADETTYWLKCLYGGEYITEAQYLSMNNDIQEIVRILVKIIKTTKERKKLYMRRGQPRTLNLQPSTLNPELSTLHTLNPQPSILNLQL